MFTWPRLLPAPCLTAYAITAYLTVILSTTAQATVIPPTGLTPGSQYQVAFVTKNARDAFSGSIATYNSFVTQAAAQNTELPATTWWAVASTGGLAQNNAKVYENIPIYNTAGQLVAANGSDFYSATHLAPIAYDQFGDYLFSQVWTGMYPNGSPDQYLDFFLPTTTYGVSDRLDGTWARGGASSNRMEARSLYGLSDPIVAVPEPSTCALAACSLVCAAWGAWRRRKRSIRASVITTSLALATTFLYIGSAHAVTIDMVTVGDAGNSPDSTGYGAVGYAYQIGKYEVTIGQYVDFLNAVAKADTYGLYAQNLMGGSSEGVISQAGSPGSYFYYASIVAYVPSPQATATNRPIAQTTWWQAARFANWMSNGQPTGAQGSATTENGAYPLAGKISGTAPAANLTNPNTGSAPLYRLPTENEWYKAAYYKSGGTNAGYWDFAAQSESQPGNVIGSSANQANYWNGFYSITQSRNLLGGQNYLVDVGSFTGSPSAYGTFDQTGNAWELNDLSGLASIDRGRRGGDWQNDWANASAMVRYDGAGSNIYGGFRLAAPVAVPEPSAWVMGAGGLGWAAWKSCRRGKAAVCDGTRA